MNDAQIKHMVDRFLNWRLPEPWNPDNGVSYKRPNYAHAPAPQDWPTGTNLFDATQADAMVRHMVDGLTVQGNDLDNPCWLIERYINGRLCYWSAGARGWASRDEWSEDIQWATRLSDRCSADQVLVHTCGGEGRATRYAAIPRVVDRG